jgi:hypothetical protein
MKSKPSTSKPDPDLAKWCAALAPRYAVDSVPPGWFTIAQISESLGKNRSTIARKMQDAVLTGRAEVKIFRIASGQRGIYPVPHYRIK